MSVRLYSYFSLSFALFLSAPREGWAFLYVMRDHDTLSVVIKKYIDGRVWGKGGNLIRIAKLNRITDPNSVPVGEVIELPSDTPRQGQTFTYVTRENDTLSKVIYKYTDGRIWGENGNLAKIMTLNRIADPDHLPVGGKVELPLQLPTGIAKEIVKNPEEAQAAQGIPPAATQRSFASAESGPKNNEAQSAPAEVESAPPPPPPLVAEVESAPPQPPPPETRFPIVVEAEYDDKSWVSLDLTPFYASNSLVSQALSGGEQVTLASSSYLGLGARFVAHYQDHFDTFLGIKLAEISFKPLTSTTKTLDNRSNLLVTIEAGTIVQLLPRLNLGFTFALENDLFVRSVTNTQFTQESVLIPSLGANLSYALAKLKAFEVDLTGVFEEKLSASTDNYTVNHGELVGGLVMIKRYVRGEDAFDLSLGVFKRYQGTSLTDQTETLYGFSAKFNLLFDKKK